MSFWAITERVGSGISYLQKGQRVMNGGGGGAMGTIFMSFCCFVISIKYTSAKTEKNQQKSNGNGRNLLGFRNCGEWGSSLPLFSDMHEFASHDA